MSRRSRKFGLIFGSVATVSGALGLAYALKYKPSFLQNLDRIDWSNLATTSKEPDRRLFTGDDLAQTIAKARDLMVRFKEEIGTPGIVVAVSIDGKTVWTEGAGLADVENGVPCGPETVMRIASISKSITMGIVARLWERGQLDIDLPVQTYLPDFPVKRVDGQEAVVTTRLLASHLAGVRHYTKRGEPAPEGDGDVAEFYLTRRCETVADALTIFRDDELMHAPGSKYLYTTHGWTLISAVAEAAGGVAFPEMLVALFRELGMRNTALDRPERILAHRARGYVRGRSPGGAKVAKGSLLGNAAYADVSCKWAGGGLVSTATDLLLFAHAMRAGRVVATETLRALWTPHPLTQRPVSARGLDAGYGLGWMVVPSRPTQTPRVGHSGGAVGASSELLVSPTVAVAALVNLQGVSLHPLVSELMLLFEALAEEKTDWDWN